MMPGGGMVAMAVLALLFGLVLLAEGQSVRRRLGLGQGRTVALDDRLLISERFGLSGRPDRLIWQGV